MVMLSVVVAESYAFPISVPQWEGLISHFQPPLNITFEGTSHHDRRRQWLEGDSGRYVIMCCKAIYDNVKGYLNLC